MLVLLDIPAIINPNPNITPMQKRVTLAIKGLVFYMKNRTKVAMAVKTR